VKQKVRRCACPLIVRQITILLQTMPQLDTFTAIPTHNIEDQSIGTEEENDNDEEIFEIEESVTQRARLNDAKSDNPSATTRARDTLLLIATLAALLIIIIYIKNPLDPKTTTNNSGDGNDSSDNNSRSGIFAPLNLTYKSLPDPSTTLTKIAFGSCSKQTFAPHPQWETLTLNKQYTRPDLLILAGDNVYGDCVNDTCTALKEAYFDLGHHASFVQMVNEIPILATLDDHDYGVGDATKNNPHKDLARGLFFDFFQLNESGQYADRYGVYQAREFGDYDLGNLVQILVLDTRYSRDEFLDTDEHMAPGKEEYVPDYDDKSKRMLGDDQWIWLEEQMARPANVRIIVSSIQVLADGHGWECWRMLPYERDRLYDLIHGSVGSSVIVSGDRHVGGIYSKEVNGTLLLEMTASSWTHTIPIGAFDSNCTSSKECDEVDERRMFDLVRVNHFGSIEIDWQNLQIELALRQVAATPGVFNDDSGSVIQSYSLSF